MMLIIILNKGNRNIKKPIAGFTLHSTQRATSNHEILRCNERLFSYQFFYFMDGVDQACLPCEATSIFAVSRRKSTVYRIYFINYLVSLSGIQERMYSLLPAALVMCGTSA